MLAQRLVRKLCPACKRPHEPSAPDLAELGSRYGGETLYTAGGCAACNYTGYDGRTGIYELLVVDDEAKALIHDAAPSSACAPMRRSAGCAGCARTGCAGCFCGITSLDEVIRVTRET